MKFFEASNIYSLNKSTYTNLRWIAYTGQLITIILVEFILEFKFNYVACIFIIFISVLTNFFLQFRINKNQLTNYTSTIFLTYDILQLGLLFFLTGAKMWQ